MWVWKLALEISDKRFVVQNVYVAGRYSVMTPDGRRINVDDVQKASLYWASAGDILAGVRIWPLSGFRVFVELYLSSLCRSLWRLYVSPVLHILLRLNSAVIHVKFVTLQMVSARFAVEQAPACSATQTTGVCSAYWNLKTWYRYTEICVDLADVLSYKAHWPQDRRLDVSVFVLIIIKRRCINDFQ